MPVYRTPDGKIIEEPTEVTPPGGAPPDGDATAATRTTRGRPGSGSRPTGPRPGYDDPTVLNSGARTRPTKPRQGPDAGSERTKLVGTIPTGDGHATEVDPVTGWLVVINGPGKGKDVRLGTGRNALGRDDSNRVALPFGDTEISRAKHLWITYDHRGRTFSVAPGDDSSNLAYLNDTPIDQRLPLPDGATIMIGKTELRFVAFCSDKFVWSDAE